MKYSAWLFCVALLLFVTQASGQQPERTNVSPALQRILQKASATDSITLVITATNLSALSHSGKIRYLYTYPAAQSALVRARNEDAATLIQEAAIIFADLHRTPVEELTTGSFDLSLNKIRLVHKLYPGINGAGILISVKEQLLDTTDIDFKGRYQSTGVAAGQPTTHASIMATIAAGGGNSSPYAKGVAWGATVTSSSFESLFPDPDSVYQQFRISVQNHSYGTGIENFYGSDALAYDLSVWNRPTLVHVFSAGNSGIAIAPNGIYAGLKAANITGSFKMSKNSITVGHVDSVNRVQPPSSRGPAYDGRIKPDLVAYGEDGSSGAAALVSGTAALLQQAYQLQHGHALPNAALVRAVLLNSADDIDTPGPDYLSGFGSLNAAEAVRTIAEKQYHEDTIRYGNLKKFTVTVPANTALFKATLAWTDMPAEVNAAKALMNNLDLSLTSIATGYVWHPWVLHTTADYDSLEAPAVRRYDTLNNVEQISVPAPPPGTYVLSVQAASLTTNHQPYAIAYQLDTAGAFVWTYPTDKYGLLGGKSTRIRWQTNRSGVAALQYSFDRSSWTTIDTVDVQRLSYEWLTPDTSRIAWLRMQFPLGEPVLSDSFTVSLPVSIKVGFDCDDSLLLYWNALTDDAYRLYTLGAQYMEPVLTTADTLVVLSKTQQPPLHYSVAPLLQGKEGFRSHTINHKMQGVGCYFSSFLASVQNNSAALNLKLGTLIGLREIIFEKWISGRFQPIRSLLLSATTTVVVYDDSLKQGINRYRVRLVLNNGTSVYSNTEAVYYFPRQPVVFYPNPAQRNEPISMLVQESDFYTVQLIDAAGRRLHQQRLDNRRQTIPLRLPASVYFVQVRGDDGTLHTQKLVVY